MDLRDDFPDLAPSGVRRILAALERRDLVWSEGDQDRVYLGDVTYYALVSRADRAEDDEDEIDWEIPLPEPAWSALLHYSVVMTSTALIKTAVEVLADRAGVEEEELAAERRSSNEALGPRPGSTRSILGQVKDAIGDVENRAAWFRTVLGVPLDYDDSA